MSDHSITIQLPQSAYERLQAMAQISNRPIEHIAMEQLVLGLDDIPDQSVFDGLSDDQLWAVIHQSFNMIEDMRLQELTQLGKEDKLTPHHEIELDQLMASFHKYVIRRSKALLALKQRGVDVAVYLAE